MNSTVPWNPPPPNLPGFTPGVIKHQYSVAKEVHRRIVTQTGQLKLGPRIGTESSYGQVNLVGDGNRFVMKTMDISTPSNNRIFDNELTIGFNPAIKIVGPKIYLWRKFHLPGKDVGQYVMDNFTKGRQGIYSMGLDEYASKYWKNMCPSPTDPIIRLLKKKLMSFWKITKGYHGDLHTGNIQVILGPGDDLKDLMIFDYGAHKRFKNLRNTNYRLYCFEDYLKTIQKQFKLSFNRKAKYYRTGFHPGPSVPTITPKGQSYRSNVNMLGKLNYSAPYQILEKNRKSLLNLLKASTNNKNKKNAKGDNKNSSLLGRISRRLGFRRV